MIIPDAKYSTISDDGYVSHFQDQEQPDRDMILKPLSESVTVQKENVEKSTAVYQS